MASLEAGRVVEAMASLEAGSVDRKTFGNPAMTGEARLGGDSKTTDSTGSGRRPQTFVNPAMTGEARLGGDSSEPMRGIFAEEPQEQFLSTINILTCTFKD
ncbi:hypothetical protein [Paramuribaculum intestinale]|uniref:hypothetical protein n=1 Tax=Paramuribaculum intestinale TaxID=2094151 RepID=UPI003F693173